MLCATAAEMRELDRITIEEVGIPGLVLMENAGAGCARAIVERCAGDVRGLPIGVVCGGGNNGGDGYVIARHLWNRGADVRIYALAPRERIRGDARINVEIAERLGIPRRASLDGLEGERVLVDAILGTGLGEPVRAPLSDAIARINAAPPGALRVAVDIPSGMDADSGHALGCVVRADVTLTMGLPKVGMVGWPGIASCGDIQVVDIGIPRDLPAARGFRVALLETVGLARLVPRRLAGANKGTFGHLLVVAGSRGKGGAALLCGEAALRGGAGLVTLAVRADVQPALEGRVRELMTAIYDGDAALVALTHGKRAVALGPGIPTDTEMQALVRRWAAELPLPMVIDADGLNALCGHTERLAGAPAARLLTPHPGEMARLLSVTTEAVQADRLGAARRLAAASGSFVACKGARTVVAAPDGRAFINPTGTAALATAGTGDVLTGLVGSLLAQGLEPLDALCLGVHAHGRAGELATAAAGIERGILAGDVVARIAAALTF
jgi:NAD(P)H-hydrate epimerase